MARKTNKTDHLLSLLAGSGQGEADAEVRQAPPAPKESKADAASVHVVNVSAEDPVSELIRENLEQEMGDAPAGEQTSEALSRMEAELQEERKNAEEMRRAAGEAKEKVARERARAEKLALSAEEAERRLIEESARADAALREKVEAGRKAARQMEMAQEELRAAEEAGERAADEMERAKEAKEAAEIAMKRAAEQMDRARQERRLLEGEEGADGHLFYNLMERIVWEKAPEYIRRFGVCTCSHCRADVIALALSKLPPKYVVVEEEAVSPLKHFYEDRYSGEISVELTKACIAVNQRPHHSRK